MRLIDADKIEYEQNEDYKDDYTGETYQYSYVRKEDIDKMPTIEAEPVKRGQWIHHAGMNSKCSCCGRYFPVAEFEQRPFDGNFCIHCGARMDGGDENA